MRDFIPVCEPLLLGREEEYVLEAVRSGWISSSGPFLKKFEDGFASYCGVKHGMSTNNGTTALHLALKALGVGPGDEVIVPDFTMVASLFAVLYCGAKPVFVDAEPDTLNMNPAEVAKKITSATKAIMPVHIFGHPVEMEPLWQLAEKHGIYLIEDAAEAHGSLYHGKKCGSLGHIACFSMFANKLITTGEGGMVVTNDDALAKKVQYYRNLCFKIDGPRDYLHDDLGYNYRFNNVQAAIGLAQLEKIEDYIALRRRNAHLYNSLLDGINGLQIPIERPNCRSVFWMYGLMVDEKKLGMSRESIMSALKERGIDTRLYFQPMHKQGVLKKFGVSQNEDMPVTDRAARNGFYLPSGSGLKPEEVTWIAEQLKSILGGKST